MSGIKFFQTVFLLGKLAAGGLLMAAVTLLGLGIAVLAYDVPVAAVPSALLWCTLLTPFYVLNQRIGFIELIASLLHFAFQSVDIQKDR